MSHYFLDSSALVKRYIPESGSTWVQTLTVPSAGNTIIVAHITQIEVVSGVARRKRDQQISARTAHAVRLLVDRHARREYMVIGLTNQIVQQSENLLEAHPLRAYDSVQLASALEANANLIAAGLTPLTFVSADTRLLTIASAEGLTTDNPNLYS